MSDAAVGGTGPIASVAAYDEFVDWEKRLGREGPFFADLFADHGVQHVVDVGSGSARHAILFAGWGKTVDAVDPSESMMAEAERNVAEAEETLLTVGGEVRLHTGGFGELAALGLGPADAVTCTGNALPHVDGQDGLRAAIEDFAAVLRQGGVLVLHLLNHSRLLAARPRAIPPVVRETAEGTKVFLRVIDYLDEDMGFRFEFLTLVRDAAGTWTTQARHSVHQALPLELLDSELRLAGFTDTRAFGSHDMKPLDLESDESVVIVAVKR